MLYIEASDCLTCVHRNVSRTRLTVQRVSDFWASSRRRAAFDDLREAVERSAALNSTLVVSISIKRSAAAASTSSRPAPSTSLRARVVRSAHMTTSSR